MIYESAYSIHVISVAAFLDAEKVDMLLWRSQSPYLNPIEYVWVTMKPIL